MPLCVKLCHFAASVVRRLTIPHFSAFLSEGPREVCSPGFGAQTKPLIMAVKTGDHV